MPNKLTRCFQRPVETFVRYPFRVLSLLGASAAKNIASCSLIWDSCDTSGLRGVLPDPIDIINHAGNVTSSTHVAILAGGIACATTKLFTGSIETERAEKMRNDAAFITGSMAALYLNAYLELGVPSNYATPDLMDVVYGVGSGMVAASMVKVNIPPRPNRTG